jgi:nucleoside-diphosphate-sugar epimerase
VNLIEAINKTAAVEKVIITSSQFVNYRAGPVGNMDDYHPFTMYGYSKMMMEKSTREIGINCAWTIIRPTRVWGFWQPGRLLFYKSLAKGLYFHPDVAGVKRAFGYVGNVVYQMVRILESDQPRLSGKTLYVGDYPILLRDWVEMFSQKLCGRNVRYVPLGLFRMFAFFGDLAELCGMSAPINSYRLESMTTSDDAPLDEIHALFGSSPFTLETAVEDTVAKLRLHEPYFRRG